MQGLTYPQGALITKNDEIRLSAALSTHSQVSSISAWIATKYILLEENRASLIKEGQEQLKSAYKFIEDFLRWRDIAFFTATHGQFVFAKLLGPDKQSHMAEFSEALQRNGLAISSGLSYHLQEPGWFRICYAVPRIVLEEGLDRLDKCLCEVE
jgi:aspartate/methionine/tyrosine aminotransferase